MNSKFNPWKILSAFIIGGIIVAATSLIGNEVSTKAAAIFYALPLTMIPIAFFIWDSSKHKYGTHAVANFMGESIPAIFGMFLFIIPFWLALYRFSFWPSLFIALGAWFVWIALTWFFICPSPLPCIPFFYRDLKTSLYRKK